MCAACKNGIRLADFRGPKFVGSPPARYYPRVVTRKYPLDPLKRVRAEKVDERARALSHALTEAEKARAEQERRELAKRELERSLAAVAAAERAKLEEEQLSVADLARGAAFGIAGEMRRAAHTRSIDEARALRERATNEAEARRGHLAAARADAKVVEKHHDEWQRARRVEIAAKEEESAEEVHAARPKEGPS